MTEQQFKIKMKKDKNYNSIKLGLRIVSISCILFICLVMYSLGHLVGVFQTSIDFENICDIKELELKYNNSCECECKYTEKDIKLAQQELLIIYNEKGYIDKTDLK